MDKQIHILLTLVLAEGGWSNLHPDHFTGRKRALVVIAEEVGSNLQPVWKMWRTGNS
jgi:hypothetical protein